MGNVARWPGCTFVLGPASVQLVLDTEAATPPRRNQPADDALGTDLTDPCSPLRGRLTTRPPRSSDWAPLPMGISRRWRGRRRRVPAGEGGRRRRSATPGCSPSSATPAPCFATTAAASAPGPGPHRPLPRVRRRRRAGQVCQAAHSHSPDCAAAGPIPPHQSIDGTITCKQSQSAPHTCTYSSTKSLLFLVPKAPQDHCRTRTPVREQERGSILLVVLEYRIPSSSSSIAI